MRRKTQYEFLKELNDLGFNCNDEYISIRTKYTFECQKCHTTFMGIYKDLKSLKKGCPKCRKNNLGKHFKKTPEQFKAEFYNNCEESEYKLNTDYINNRIKVQVTHLTCGNTFLVSPNNFISKGSRCPICKNKEKSKGERIIYNYLKSKGFSFEYQYGFDELIDLQGKPYLFDFKVNTPTGVIMIEYDGEQHFKPCKFGGISEERALEEYNKVVIRDKLKTLYCKDNDINLIRINFKQFKKITNLLDNILIPSEAIKETYGTCND